VRTRSTRIRSAILAEREHSLGRVQRISSSSARNRGEDSSSADSFPGNYFCGSLADFTRFRPSLLAEYKALSALCVN
jgi:hypothetical protein